jgi:inorganic triphosphatase YgiF
MVLTLCQGKPLRELFSLDQERHLRLILDEGRPGSQPMGELSLDIVKPVLPNAPSYYELEVELLDPGLEQELRRLATLFRNQWGLQPVLQSKFERGLEALSENPKDRGGN